MINTGTYFVLVLLRASYPESVFSHKEESFIAFYKGNYSFF